jgi:DNA-binding GntR family transcriptional regulator
MEFGATAHTFNPRVQGSIPWGPTYLYEFLAVRIQEEIGAGRWTVGQSLPPFKEIAASREGSAATVQRAVKLLVEWGYVEVVPGRGARVRGVS